VTPAAVLALSGTTFPGFHGSSRALLVASGIAAVVWLLVFAVRYAASFPKLPSPGAETGEPGPESPAVANLLVNRWHVTKAAVPATLLDLAARRFIEIGEAGPQQYVVRVIETGGGHGELTPYERQVLDLVRSVTRGGMVPVGALNLGESDAESWWKRFSTAVRADARRAGLAGRRWRPSDIVLVAGGLFVVLELAALALGVADYSHYLNQSSTNGHHSGRWDWNLAALLPVLVAIAVMGSDRSIRDTPAGREACARWLGVRRFLRRDREFNDLPPPAVAVRGRVLADAVGLGVAHGAERELRLLPEDPETAWARSGGIAHQVRVEYPHRFGAGEKPGRVFVNALVRVVLWGAIGVVVLPVVGNVVWGLLRDSHVTEKRGNTLLVVAAVLGVLGLIGIYVAFQVVDGLVRLVRSASDFGRTVVVEGEVIKHHQGHIAVDPGEHNVARAFVPPPAVGGATTGASVRAEVSPHLWYCRALTVTTAAPPVVDGPGAQRTAAMTGAATLSPMPGHAAAPPGVAELDDAAVSALAGTPLHADPHAAGPAGAAFPGATVQAWRGEGPTRVALTRSVGGPLLAAFGHVGERAGTHAQSLDGVGDEAYWGQGHLVARRGDVIVLVEVTLPGRGDADALALEL